MILSTALLALLASAATASNNIGIRHRSLNYFEDYFADGLETQYNDYAQAWRYLGIYVDCDAQEEQRRRRLEDGEEEEGDDAAAEGDDAAGDDQEEEQQDAEEEEEAEEDKYCYRYLLWGAVSCNRAFTIVPVS